VYPHLSYGKREEGSSDKKVFERKKRDSKHQACERDVREFQMKEGERKIRRLSSLSKEKGGAAGGPGFVLEQ